MLDINLIKLIQLNVKSFTRSHQVCTSDHSGYYYKKLKSVRNSFLN